MNKNDETLIQQICQHLDRSVLQLDDSTSSRLDKARETALQRTPIDEPALEEAMFVDSVLTSLEDQEQAPYISSRLDAIRAQALSRQACLEGKTDSTRVSNLLGLFGGIFSLPASMLATACVLVTVVSLFYVGSNSNRNLSVDEELTLIASAEDLELYENLDFYLWLEENGFAN